MNHYLYLPGQNYMRLPVRHSFQNVCPHVDWRDSPEIKRKSSILYTISVTAAFKEMALFVVDRCVAEMAMADG